MKRLDFVGIAFAITSIVFCLFGFSRIESNTEDVLQWLPDQSVAREQFNFFAERFGSDDFVIVTWEGCTVSDPRQEALTEYIRENDPERLIQSATSGADITRRLARDMKMSWEAISNRLTGVFFGVENPEQTCILVVLSKSGTADRSGSMELIWKAVEFVPNLSREQVSMGGYPFVATIIDRQLKGSFRSCLLPSVILATFISLCCLRNLVLTLIVFLTAVVSAAASISIVPICGMKFGGLMSIIPALVFVLATSGSIHLIRYSLDRIGDARKLLKIGWKPCVISTVTTAIGMLSLARSDFPAIRNFGCFCAAGVGFALASQLIMIPWLLSRVGTVGLTKLANRNTGSAFWGKLIVIIGRRRVSISVVSLLIMALGGIGLSKLFAEVEVEKLFSPKSEILMSLANLEKQLGPMDQTELLVIFDNVDSEAFSDRANLVRKIQSGIAGIPQIGVTHSLASLLPSEPLISNAKSFARRSFHRSLLRRERDNFANSNLLNIDTDSETWRISIRFPFTEKSDFGKLAKDVVAVSSAIVSESEPANPWETNPFHTRLMYTGKTHLFHQAQLNLMADLFHNFALAFLIITPILIVVLRSLAIGLIAMLPNLFPILVVFGTLGWCGHPVDLAIAMTACVALGIAVDDTTHFLVRFRDYGGGLDNIVVPIKKTMGQCGPAMLHTTLIGSAGLIVYYFSEMLVVSQFAWAIAVLLVIALLADVIMLPAILFLFCRSNDENNSDSLAGGNA